MSYGLGIYILNLLIEFTLPRSTRHSKTHMTVAQPYPLGASMSSALSSAAFPSLSSEWVVNKGHQVVWFPGSLSHKIKGCVWYSSGTNVLELNLNTAFVYEFQNLIPRSLLKTRSKAGNLD
ncbi:hypothetical protein ACSBR2_008850 [Camellia fascicularis]